MTTVSIHDSMIAFPMIDAGIDHECILIDAAYNSSSIYAYIIENTHSIPVINTNKRMGIVPYNLTFNGKQEILIKKIQMKVKM